MTVERLLDSWVLVLCAMQLAVIFSACGKPHPGAQRYLFGDCWTGHYTFVATLVTLFGFMFAVVTCAIYGVLVRDLFSIKLW